jgi:hypothetical protein
MPHRRTKLIKRVRRERIEANMQKLGRLRRRRLFHSFDLGTIGMREEIMGLPKEERMG